MSQQSDSPRRFGDSRVGPMIGHAAGVPFIAVPPSNGPRADAPVVVAWHLLDPPRTEAAFAAALPLEGIDAWRIYLGLPMSGSRLPAGGFDELMRRAYEDAVLKLHGPIASQAAEEFEAAFASLRQRLGHGDGPLAVLGGSAGAAVALIVLTEGTLRIRAAVLVSPLLQLHRAVEAVGQRYGVSYPWADASLEVARRLDFVARADEVAARGQPAILFIVGRDDDPGFREPAEQMRTALASRYADPRRAELVVIPGMGHALAEEPGMEPAPQTREAALVDREAVRWLERYLPAQRPRSGCCSRCARPRSHRGRR